MEDSIEGASPNFSSTKNLGRELSFPNDKKYFESCYKPNSTPWTCRKCAVDFTKFKLWIQHQQEYHPIRKNEYLTLSWSNPSRMSHGQTNAQSVQSQFWFQPQSQSRQNLRMTRSALTETVYANDNVSSSNPSSPYSSSSSSRSTTSNENEEEENKQENESIQKKDYSNMITTKEVKGVRKHFCNVCKKPFTRLFQAKKHLVTHTGEKPYKCSQCPKVYANRQNLKVHYESCHAQNQSFECGICEKSFWTRQQRYQHRKRVHALSSSSFEAKNTFNCSKCQRKFSMLLELKIHMVRSHKNPLNLRRKVQPLKSSLQFPSTSFRSLANPNITRKFVKGQLVIGCKYCNKTFPNVYQAVKHTWTHTNEIPFKCRICQATFTTKHSLKYHAGNTHKMTLQEVAFQKGSNPTSKVKVEGTQKFKSRTRASQANGEMNKSANENKFHSNSKFNK